MLQRRYTKKEVERASAAINPELGTHRLEPLSEDEQPASETSASDASGSEDKQDAQPEEGQNRVETFAGAG